MIIQHGDGEGCSLPISVLFMHLPGVATSRCCRHLDLMPFSDAVVVYLCRSSGSSRYIAQLFVSPPTYIAVCLPPCLFSSPPEMCLYGSDFPSSCAGIQHFSQLEGCKLATHTTHLPLLPRQQMFQQMPGGVGTLTASLLWVFIEKYTS